MIPVVAIRPEPGLASTIDSSRKLGLEVHGFALSQVEPLDWELPSADEFDGLLVGSANAFRHAGAGLASLRHLPVIAVGETTARAAEEQGFSVEKSGEGGLQAMLESLGPQPRTLLQLAGEERVSLDPPENVRIEVRTCYRLTYRPIPDDLAIILRNQCLVLLHSAASARLFSSECDRLALDRGKISLAALGPRILAAAGTGWRQAHSPHKPAEAALLALARDMCH